MLPNYLGDALQPIFYGAALHYGWNSPINTDFFFYCLLEVSLVAYLEKQPIHMNAISSHLYKVVRTERL